MTTLNEIPTVESNPPSSSTSTDDIHTKLNLAHKMKDEGNAHFKNKSIQEALRAYHKALLYAKGVQQDLNPPVMVEPRTPVTEGPVADAVTALVVTVNNNIAACLLKHTPVPHERVLACCEQVIKLDPENVKAWYRKGQALCAKKSNDQAKVAVLRANRLTEGKDPSIRRLLASIEAEQKKEQESFNNMFRDKLLQKQIS